MWPWLLLALLSGLLLAFVIADILAARALNPPPRPSDCPTPAPGPVSRGFDVDQEKT